MSDLVEFLRARLDEDEQRRWRLHDIECVATVEDEIYTAPERRDCDCAHPARVLAEVAAKRAILALHTEAYDSGSRGCYACDQWPCATMLALSQPYAGHPDFDLAWRGEDAATRPFG